MITIIKNYSMQDIIDGMRHLLDLSAKSELVKQHAISIAGEREDKISAVYDWVRDNLAYVKDPETSEKITELFISPVKQLEWYNEGVVIGGDCDDHALLSTALYRALGIRAKVMLIDSGSGQIDHAYCEVWSEKLGKGISADTTARYPLGWIIPANKVIVVS